MKQNLLYYAVIILSMFVASQAISSYWGNRRGSYENDTILDLGKYLQPNGIESHDFLGFEEHILCARDCNLHPQHRTCYYKFTVEQFHVMSPACKNCPKNLKDCDRAGCVPADGIERTILTVNRKLPGPPIHVCHGDRIIVDVHNRMPARSVSIHWHGLEQIGTPWMDGVPYLTQCPLSEGQLFRYKFYADPPGTHMWHAHTGFQLLDGLSGPFIVRETDANEKQKRLYDFDLYTHTIFIQEWLHVMADNKYPGYNGVLNMIGIAADTYLINGRGRYVDPKTGDSTSTPYTVFNVDRNRRYRFRIIGATSLMCSCVIAVEGHSMLLIATDGHPIVPTVVGSITVTSGEMFDVVIDANNAPGSYWIRVDGRDECKSAYQSAILRYSESATVEPKTLSTSSIITDLGLTDINNVNHGCSGDNPNYTCLDCLTSLDRIPPRLLQPEPDFRIILSAAAHIYTVEELYDFNTHHRYYLPVGHEIMATDTFNNISCVLPPFPLLTQDDPIPEEILCPADTSICAEKICECLNIKQISLNAVVEVVVTDDILDDDAKFDHPIHLHGYRFIVLKQGTYEERQRPDYYKDIPLKDQPVIKDTAAVPNDGYIVIRFLATNPGIWTLHCHFVFHNHNGMMIVLQVGDRKLFPKTPPDFPTCGNYAPPVVKHFQLSSVHGPPK